MATISNINIDVDEDPGKKKLQGSKPVVSHSQGVDLPVSHDEGRGKPDSSAPPHDSPPDLQSVPGDAIKEGEEFVSKGLHSHQDKQAPQEANPMDLLKDTNVKSSGLALKTYRSIKNDTVTLLKGAPTHPSEIQVSNPEDDVLLSYYIFTLIMSLKGCLESTEKLLEPFPALVSINFNYLYKLKYKKNQWTNSLWLHT